MDDAPGLFLADLQRIRADIRVARKWLKDNAAEPNVGYVDEVMEEAEWKMDKAIARWTQV